ncbi:unnamed protein product [Cyclocybe aegerita]|uniref:Myb/SANT-like domain-containing protein n=1 Tax=Cyclocybe aegerita TaxID=1973307 RepID=A0A8S0XQ01_CYCAE|nr:unnamed protein product [Cyclocybe aegerita]
MAQNQHDAPAYWTKEDETRLLNFLFDHLASGGDGANFKKTTFQLASVENKWNMLHRTFCAIQAIKDYTGWNWTDEGGANITETSSHYQDWLKFVKIHKLAAPFMSKGWAHLDKMTQIMPVTVRGHHIFRPSQNLTGMSAARDGTPPLAAEVNEPVEDEDGPAATPVVDQPVAAADEGSGGENVGDDDHDNDDIPWEATPPPLAPPEEVTPPHLTTSVSTSRKRQCAASETPVKSVKKSRATGADAIHGLTKSIDNFGVNICKVLAMDPSLRTPQRRKDAVTEAQKESWLPPVDRLVFCNVLERDISVIDTYLALNKKDVEFSHLWIQDKVDQAKEACFTLH